MGSLSLPILSLAVREQRYSCHGCGNCCRDFTVQLRDEDLAKLRAQKWEEKLGEPVTIEFRGRTYLRQRADGACMFLMEGGLCRIHAEQGFSEKPIACQLFPFLLTPSASRSIEMGLSFACQSVLENKGAELKSHTKELSRMAGELEELHAPAGPPRLTDKLRASTREEEDLQRRADAWLQMDVNIDTRLEGLAWVAASLCVAKLDSVRDQRFAELVDVLFGALPGELEHIEHEDPGSRRRKLLREAVFARTEDLKLNRVAAESAWRTRLSQLMRSRRFKSGRGLTPRIGVEWPGDVPLKQVEMVGPAREESEADAIDDLMTRWLRCSILGGRAWGSGYYGWPMVHGLAAMVLNAAAVSWLARLHAAGRGASSIQIQDVRAALGRIDRSAGRAAWLGSSAERLRLLYLRLDHGLLRLVRAYAMVDRT